MLYIYNVKDDYTLQAGRVGGIFLFTLRNQVLLPMAAARAALLYFLCLNNPPI